MSTLEQLVDFSVEARAAAEELAGLHDTGHGLHPMAGEHIAEAQDSLRRASTHFATQIGHLVVEGDKPEPPKLRAV